MLPSGSRKLKPEKPCGESNTVVESIDAVDLGESVADGHNLVARADVDPQCEATEACGERSVVGFVVACRVERKAHAVAQLEHPVNRL